mmetsp:Transcript_10640/g.24689  ORF Transcript_10640/g.24689 Transcript_10640/m.24689 type:complete len:243 (-) Transcript_10640:1364-2092(-)
MQNVTCELLHVFDQELRVGADGDGAEVAHLAARLRVEGGLIEHQPHQPRLGVDRFDELLGRIDRCLEKGAACLARARRVPDVLEGIVSWQDAHSVLERVGLLGEELERLEVAEPPLELGGLPSLGHGLVIALRIHAEPLLLAHEQREVERKAVRVVHLEGVGSRQHRRLVQLPALLLELGDSAFERRGEDSLLLLEDRLHRGRLLPQLWEAVGHHLHDHVHQLVEEAFGCSQDLAAVTHGAA